MSWFYAYLCLAAAAYLPRLAMSEPLSPFTAPGRVWVLRLRAVLSPWEPFPLAGRVRLGLRWVVLLLNQALWNFLWTLDDIFYPAYREVDLAGAVFIVGGFRTGSTSLHRTLALDTERFVCPRMLEFVFPFVAVHRAFDYLEWLDLKVGTRFIACIDGIFNKVCGEELRARHPMGYYEAEEDDVLFAANYGVGWYSAIQFPSPKVWMEVGQFSKMTPEEQSQLWFFYQRVMQKVLYRRGGPGRVLLSKSHLIEFIPVLAAHIPNARFVDIVRHPKDSFVSWYALQQAASRNFSGFEIPEKLAVEAHCEFWRLFFEQEMIHFNNAKGTDPATRSQLTFNQYHEGPDRVVLRLYKQWGLAITPKLRAALAEHQKEHQLYKVKQKYRNPTLADLGLTEADIEERYRAYIETARVSQHLSPAPVSPRY